MVGDTVVVGVGRGVPVLVVVARRGLLASRVIGPLSCSWGIVVDMVVPGAVVVLTLGGRWGVLGVSSISDLLR